MRFPTRSQFRAWMEGQPERRWSYAWIDQYQEAHSQSRVLHDKMPEWAQLFDSETIGRRNEARTALRILDEIEGKKSA